jgi:paired amphipathic helix protein Sin3a
LLFVAFLWLCREEKQLLLLTQTNYYAFVSSVDFSSCPIVTPSYRELPAAIQPPHSSGRTATCDEVLNDRCVSTATGSEDYSFKSSRKNIYEENLFKVEDERFELDMLIENNAAAIRVLEPIAEQAAVMSPEQSIRLKLGENIDTLHLRAITRVYADSAYEIIELLQKSPAATAKIILSRLRQKDLEWRQVRSDMKNQWRKVTEANYARSLDHRSFYFKQEDKKRRSPKALMNELREVHQQVFGPKLGEDMDEWGFSSIGSAVGEESIMLRQIRQGHAPQPIYTYCMSFKYPDNSIHQQLYDIITQTAKLTATEKDVVAIQAFFTGFVHQFCDFKLDEKSVQEQAELRRRLEENLIKDEEERSSQAANYTAAELLMQEEKSAAAAAAMSVTNLAESAIEEEEEDDLDESAVSSSLQSSNLRKRKVGRGVGKRRGGIQQGPKRRRGLTATGEEEEEDDLLEPEVEVDRSKSSLNPVAASRMGFDRIEAEDEGEDTLLSTANHSIDNSRLDVSSIKRDASTSGGIGNLSARVPSIYEIGQRIAAAESMQPSNKYSSSSVKPLRVQMDTWSIEEKLHPVRRHTRPSRLFFGSNAYYVFFRLHQFLYERLLTARQLAHKTRKTSSNRKNKLPVTPEERELRFSNLLEQLLTGKLEQAKFEDECRNLLGAGSYVLFTVDKLIQQLVKQTLALLNSDTSLQLLCLYQYELVRAKSSPINLERSAQLCRMYHSNCQSILAEDNCTQIEFFHDTKELGIGLIEALSQPESQPKSEEWSKYLEQLINQQAQFKMNKAVQFTAAQPFLKRNITKFARTFIHQRNSKLDSKLVHNFADDLDLLYSRVMKNVQCRNELEAKIDLRSCKVYYVEDTSDFLYRSNRKKSTSTPNNHYNPFTNNRRVSKLEELEANKYSNKVETIITRPIKALPAKLQQLFSRKQNSNNYKKNHLREWAQGRFHELFPNYANELAEQQAEEDARALTEIKLVEETEESKMLDDVAGGEMRGANASAAANPTLGEDAEMLEDEGLESSSVSDAGEVENSSALEAAVAALHNNSEPEDAE